MSPSGNEESQDNISLAAAVEANDSQTLQQLIQSRDFTLLQSEDESDEEGFSMEEEQRLGEEADEKREGGRLPLKMAGKPRFTAQLRAAGYGGFHGQRMQFLKHLIEQQSQGFQGG